MTGDDKKNKSGKPDDLFGPPKSKNPNKGISHEDLWNERFRQLELFKERFGTVSVPCDFEGGLGKWLTNQRQKRKHGDLRRDREEKLTRIGIEWKFRCVLPWKDRFENLKAFKRKYGHCNVPQNDSTGLGNWVTNQRLLKSRNVLSVQRSKWLTDLGFQWKLYNGSYWEESFHKLERFKTENGHCNVPLRHSVSLCRWVQDQRAKKRLGTLRKYQEQKLLDLGMQFGTSRRTWDGNFKLLGEFKKMHGNCDVPMDYKNNLGRWVCKQRYRAREGFLSENQVERLKDIGIDWNRKRRRRKSDSGGKRLKNLKPAPPATTPNQQKGHEQLDEEDDDESSSDMNDLGFISGPMTSSAAAAPRDSLANSVNAMDGSMSYANHLLAHYHSRAAAVSNNNRQTLPLFFSSALPHGYTSPGTSPDGSRITIIGCAVPPPQAVTPPRSTTALLSPSTYYNY